MKWFFFKTLREKRSILKKLKRGDVVPFIKYVVYRFRLSSLFRLKRKWYTMRVFYSPFAFWLWTHEGAEKEEEMFFESFLKEGDIVVDCGAHIGTLTITASRIVGEKGKVFSYEAHPRTFSYLKRNTEDNDCRNVLVKNVAIGKKKGVVSFSDYYASDLNSVEDVGKFLVEMETLDHLLKDVGIISLLKLDIEGSELPALLGAREVLKRTRAVYFESAERSFKRFGYALDDIVVFLNDNGFTCYLTSKDGLLQEVQRGHVTKMRYENIVAIAH